MVIPFLKDRRDRRFSDGIIVLVTVGVIVGIISAVIYFRKKSDGIQTTQTKNWKMRLSLNFNGNRSDQRYINVRNILAFDISGNPIFPVPSTMADTNVYGMVGNYDNLFQKSNTITKTLEFQDFNKQFFWGFFDVPAIHQLSVVYERANPFTWNIQTFTAENPKGIDAVYTPSTSSPIVLDTVNYFPQSGTNLYDNNGAPNGFRNWML